MKNLKVERLTEDAFKPFGRILGRPAEDPNAVRDDLNAWLGFADLYGMEAKNPVWAFLEVKRVDTPLNQLERHMQAAEAFVPLEGSSVILVAPPTHNANPEAGPDDESVRAFLLDGSAGIFFPKGTWHWAPSPVGETATFLLLLDRDILDDIEIQEVEPRRLML